MYESLQKQIHITNNSVPTIDRAAEVQESYGSKLINAAHSPSRRVLQHERLRDTK